jgi:long-chain acyl-CoA synthetase
MDRPVSVYDQRPWLGRYRPGDARDITVEHRNALEMFRASLRQAPDGVLVRYFGTDLTVAEVDRLTDALAAAFVELGLEPGGRVAVFLQNVPQFLLAMLATWKAGGIMVSANPMYRERELAHVLHDSEPTLLVALESLYEDVAASVVAGTSVRAVITTSELDYVGDTPPPTVLAGVERRRPGGTHDLRSLVEHHLRSAAPTAEPHEIAFLTYTSGTTGPPKGAMNTHRAVVFNAQTYRQWMELSTDDVIFGVAPLFHITGLVATLATGLLIPAPMVLGYRFDPTTALDLIERYRCTFTVGSITVFIAFMHDPTAASRDLSSLVKVWSGGQAIAPTTVEEFQRRFGPYIHNIYGMTETTSPSHAVPRGAVAPVDPSSGALSVGVPTYGVVARVVDDEGRDVPPGEIGEIVMAGPQVVPGYWRRPEETAAAIRDGAIHSGDVGFMDAEGWFYVVDRKKDLINASGYKVWPREVEDVLYRHPAVREAAVVGVPDAYRGETVKAYVSLRAGVSAAPHDLIAFCRKELAAYKYPREVEILDDLPKTPTGKILRRSLRSG